LDPPILLMPRQIVLGPCSQPGWHKIPVIRERKTTMPFNSSAAPRDPRPQGNRQLVFTSSQAAHYLGVSLATIRRWADAGHLSCYRTPGGQRRFSREQLDEFTASLHSTGLESPPAGSAFRAA
jgi:excisionase family DNA binding protein